jgi:hypothetical protein
MKYMWLIYDDAKGWARRRETERPRLWGEGALDALRPTCR